MASNQATMSALVSPPSRSRLTLYPSSNVMSRMFSLRPSSRSTSTSTSSSSTTTPVLTVRFPGAYTDTDPGLLVPTIFDPSLNYDALFPGPEVDANLNAGSGGGVAITAPDPQGPRSAVLGGVSRRWGMRRVRV